MKYLLLSCWIIARVPLSAQTVVRVRDLMTPAEFTTTGLAKLSPTEMAALDLWFNQSVAKVLTLAAAQTGVQSNPPGSGTLAIEDLEGAIVVADDGQALGKITTNQFDTQSFLNQFGAAGNEFNSNSILNQFGKYGNEFSALSPFNRFSATPPRIIRGNRVLGYLTRNAAKAPRLDPDVLLAWIKAKR